MIIKVINNDEEFYKLKNDWIRIVNEVKNITPFQSWEWNYYWWQNYGKEKKLNIVLAYDKKKLLGIAPMYIENRIIKFIGERDSDFGDFIILKNNYRVLQNLVKSLLKTDFKKIQLKEMRSDSENFHILKRLIKNKIVYIYNSTMVPYVEISKYEDYEEFNTFLEGEFRRRLKREKKFGEEMKFLRNVKINKELIKEMEHIYEKRQSERVGKSNLNRIIPFVEALNNCNLFYISFLKINEKIACFSINIEFKNKIYCYILGINSDFKYADIGHLMAKKHIQCSFENRLEEFNFLRGDYEFKLKWNTDLKTNYNIEIYSSRLLKNINILKNHVKNLGRNIVHKNKVVYNLWKKISKL